MMCSPRPSAVESGSFPSSAAEGRPSGAPCATWRDGTSFTAVPNAVVPFRRVSKARDDDFLAPIQRGRRWYRGFQGDIGPVRL
jgi:hypothetical protein